MNQIDYFFLARVLKQCLSEAHPPVGPANPYLPGVNLVIQRLIEDFRQDNFAFNEQEFRNLLVTK